MSEVSWPQGFLFWRVWLGHRLGTFKGCDRVRCGLKALTWVWRSPAGSEVQQLKPEEAGHTHCSWTPRSWSGKGNMFSTNHCGSTLQSPEVWSICDLGGRKQGRSEGGGPQSRKEIHCCQMISHSAHELICWVLVKLPQLWCVCVGAVKVRTQFSGVQGSKSLRAPPLRSTWMWVPEEDRGISSPHGRVTFLQEQYTL